MQRKLTVILASVFLLIALVSIGRRLSPAAPSINRSRYVGLGQVLAEETIEAVAGHGQIVAVVSDAQHRYSADPLWASFQAALKQPGSVRLMATEVISSDPRAFAALGDCSRFQLNDILAKYATADAIVFFVGLPEWRELEAANTAPRPGGPKIIVAAVESAPQKRRYRGYFANGILSVLISLRPHPGQLTQPNTPRASFDQYYQIYTPQTFESLPD